MTWRYLRLCLKYYILSPPIWGWAIGFMMFWLLLGYIDIGSFIKNVSKYIPSREALTDAALAYTAAWFGSVAIVALSSASVSLCKRLFAASMSIRYLTKYSKLRAHSIYLQNVVGFLVLCLFISSIMLATTVTLYSKGFSIPMIPKNVWGLYLTIIATGLLYYSFSETLSNLVLVLRKPKAETLISYLPLILSIGLIYSAINVDLGYVNIVSPFNAATILMIHYYTGKNPPISAYASLNPRTVSPVLPWISLIAWIIAFSLASIAMIKKQRGVSIEELATESY